MSLPVISFSTIIAMPLLPLLLSWRLSCAESHQSIHSWHDNLHPRFPNVDPSLSPSINCTIALSNASKSD
jgi:hypothetical protein